MSRPITAHTSSRFVLALVIIMSATLAASPASARKAIVADVHGEPDVRAEANALTILLRTTLEGAGLKVVPRNQLAQVLDSLQKEKRPTYALVVRGAEARRVMHSLSAQVLVSGTIAREGTRLKAGFLVYALGREKPIRLDRTAPHGQVAKLAGKVAHGIAAQLKLKKADAPDASLGELYAHTRASAAALAGDTAATVQALRAGDPSLSTRIPAMRETGRILAQTEKIPIETRLDAALFSGNFALAERMADRALESKPRDELALATKAFVKLQKGEVEEAQALLSRAGSRKRKDLTRLTRAAAAHRTGKKSTRDAELSRLVRKGYLPALRLIATVTPGDLSPRLEQAVLKAARKNVGNWPSLASSLGLRAASGGLKPEAGLDLVRVGLLSTTQLQQLEPLLTQAISSGWPVGFRLQGELYLMHGKLAKADDAMVRAVHSNANDDHAHRLRGYILLEQGDTPAAARSFEAAVRTAEKRYSGVGPRPGSRYEYLRTLNLMGDSKGAEAVEKQLAKKLDLEGARATRLDLQEEEKGWSTEPTTELTVENRAGALVDAFRPVAGAFAVLSGKTGMTVAMAPLKPSAWFDLWPAEVHPNLAGEALRQVLAAPPYLLQISDTAPVPQSDISATRLDTISSNAGTDGLLLFLLSPHLLSVKVRLVYYHVVNGEAFEYETTLDRKTAFALGLITLKPTYIRVAAGVLALLILIVLYRTFRGFGTVKVRIQRDPVAKNQAYVIKLSRSPRAPKVNNPERHEDSIMAGGAKLGRLQAIMPRRNTTFGDVPTGTWHVHLYGTHKRGGHLETIRGEFSREIQVGRGDTVSLSFNLEPTTAGLQVRVYDGGKSISDAAVWLGDDRDDVLYTDKTGRATLQVPRRELHTLNVEFQDQVVQRRVEFDDTSLHHLTINLARERSQSDVEMAEDSDPNMQELLEPTSQAEAFIEDDLTPPPPVSTEAGGIQLVSLDDRQDKVDMGIDYSAVFGGGTPSGERRKAAPSAGSGEHAVSGLDRYELLEELGRGGMGVVHRARDQVLEREVALKIIGAELKDHPDARRFFLAEAKAMAALNHPNLVMIFDQGWAGDQTFVVMEYVEGNTLEQIIADQGPPPIARGLDFFDQLCCGLAFAHSRNIIHRDIKPENVFISSDGVVKLGDFGLAKVARDMQIKRTQVRGTPMYMAPEQIRGKDIDHRADIYSLGCTAFAMFCGRPPFVEGEVMYHHIHTAPPLPSDLSPHLPPELDRVLLACLAKPKAKRVPSVEELRKAIKPLLARLS